MKFLAEIIVISLGITLLTYVLVELLVRLALK